MIVHYFDADGTLLLTRPQTALPLAGDAVTLEPRAGTPPTTYTVAERHWHLVVPNEGDTFYSLTDAAEEHVHVTLREE